MGISLSRAVAVGVASLALGYQLRAEAGLQEGLEAFGRGDYSVAEFEFARSAGPDALYYLGLLQVGGNGGKVLSGMNALQQAIRAGHFKAEELLAVTCQGGTCGPRPARECAFFERPIERSACTVGRERLRRAQQPIQVRQGPLPVTNLYMGDNSVIEAGSIFRDGNIVRYRIRVSVAPPMMSSVSDIGVDCIARTRIDYLTVSFLGDREIARTPASSSELRRVFDGTRQADELDRVCTLADGAAGRTTVFPDVAQQAPAPAPSTSPGPAPAQPTPDRSAPASRTTLTIKSTGSGFYVSAAGDFLTNHHVVEGCERVEVVVSSRKRLAEVIARDEDIDLALLKTQGPSAAIALASEAPELGEAVVVLGYPLSGVLGDDLRVTTGVVSSLSGIGSDRRYMQISASVQPGNSGGPVLDPRGTVAAVVVAKLAARFKAENVNFGIRAPLLRSFLEIHGVRSRANAPSAKGVPTVAEAVRRSSPAVAQVLCYGR